MAGEISEDVRDVVRRAIEDGHTYEEAARIAGVGRASVSRWLRRLREVGSMAAKERGGGNRSILSGEAFEVLKEIAMSEDNFTDQQITDAFVARTGQTVSRSSIRRALQRNGLSRKRSSTRPQSATDQM